MTSPSLITSPPPQVAARAASAWRRIGIPAALFVVTMFSTTAVGMRYMHNFLLGVPPLATDADVLPYRWVFENIKDFGLGLPFSITLIGILLAHEFGHYFACRAFRVEATLPYLLPAPSLSGTFGAVIRLKSKVRSRAALISIGAWGPVAGFAVAIVTVMVGISLSKYAAIPVVTKVQPPVLISGMAALMGHGAALPLIVPHPVLIASWIGLLITALNLIPAGQLDGGHILYAISPAAHRISTRVVVVALLAMGFFFWAGWILWGLLLVLPGMRHPKVSDVRPVRKKHFLLIPICAVILCLTATFQPFKGFSVLDIVKKSLDRYHHVSPSNPT